MVPVSLSLHLIRENHCPPSASFMSLLYLRRSNSHPTCTTLFRRPVHSGGMYWTSCLRLRRRFRHSSSLIDVRFQFLGAFIIIIMKFTYSRALHTDPIQGTTPPAPVQWIACGISWDLTAHLLNSCNILKRPSNPNTTRKLSLSSARTGRPMSNTR